MFVQLILLLICIICTFLLRLKKPVMYVPFVPIKRIEALQPFEVEDMDAFYAYIKPFIDDARASNKTLKVAGRSGCRPIKGAKFVDLDDNKYYLF